MAGGRHRDASPTRIELSGEEGDFVRLTWQARPEEVLAAGTRILRALLVLRVHPLRVSVRTTVLDDDLKVFAADVCRSVSDLSGGAKLAALDGHFEIEMQSTGRGKFEIAGCVRPRPGLALSFSFNTDQSYLSNLSNQRLP